MTPEEFRKALARMNLQPGQLADIMRALGDPADHQTVSRRIRRWAKGEAKVPGEAIALLTLLERVRNACSQLTPILGRE